MLSVQGNGPKNKERKWVRVEKIEREGTGIRAFQVQSGCSSCKAKTDFPTFFLLYPLFSLDLLKSRSPSLRVELTSKVLPLIPINFSLCHRQVFKRPKRRGKFGRGVEKKWHLNLVSFSYSYHSSYFLSFMSVTDIVVSTTFDSCFNHFVQ